MDIHVWCVLAFIFIRLPNYLFHSIYLECPKTHSGMSCCYKIYKEPYRWHQGISCNSPNTIVILAAYTSSSLYIGRTEACAHYVRHQKNVTKPTESKCNNKQNCLMYTSSDARKKRRHEYTTVRYRCKVQPRSHPLSTTRPVVSHTSRHHHTDKDVTRLHHVTTNTIIYTTTSPQKNVTIVGSVCGTIVVMLLSVFLIFIIRKRICFSQPTKDRSFRHTRNNPGYDLQKDFTPIDKPKPTTKSKVIYNVKDTPKRVNIGASVQQRDSENDVYTYANLALTNTDYNKNENRDNTSTYDHGYFHSTADKNDAYDHTIHWSVLPNNNDNTYDNTIRTTDSRDIDGTYDHNFGPTTDDDYDVTGSYKRSGNCNSYYTGYDSYQ